MAGLLWVGQDTTNGGLVFDSLQYPGAQRDGDRQAWAARAAISPAPPRAGAVARAGPQAESSSNAWHAGPHHPHQPDGEAGKARSAAGRCRRPLPPGPARPQRGQAPAGVSARRRSLRSSAADAETVVRQHQARWPPSLPEALRSVPVILVGERHCSGSSSWRCRRPVDQLDGHGLALDPFSFGRLNPGQSAPTSWSSHPA